MFYHLLHYVLISMLLKKTQTPARYDSSKALTKWPTSEFLNTPTTLYKA